MDYEKEREIAKRLMAVAKDFQPGPLGRLSSGMGRGEMAVLMAVENASVPLCPSDIAGVLRFSTNRVANSLKRLTEKGYIRFGGFEGDKRKHTVLLTEKGQTFAREGRERMLDACHELIADLGEEDALELVRILEKAAAVRKSRAAGKEVSDVQTL